MKKWWWLSFLLCLLVSLVRSSSDNTPMSHVIPLLPSIVIPCNKRVYKWYIVCIIYKYGIETVFKNCKPRLMLYTITVMVRIRIFWHNLSTHVTFHAQASTLSIWIGSMTSSHEFVHIVYVIYSQIIQSWHSSPLTVVLVVQYSTW